MTALIVDDVPSVRMVIGNWLEELGVASILYAAGGDEAWNLLMDSAQKIDFLILDWSMPEMDGLELLSRLRLWEAHQKTPVIVVSAERSSLLLNEAQAMKASAILPKPFSKADLAQALVSCGIPVQSK